MRLALATTAAVLGALLLAAPADAQLRWRGCAEADGMRCATLRVPLDRAGALPGTVPLRVARVSLSRNRDRHLMYLSGGPGGAGVLEMLDVLLEVPRLLRDFTILGFDQRGTGRSGLLRCRALERDARLRSTRAGEECAGKLGPARSFYTTADSVADMEAYRQAVGAGKLTLYGTSYGTELALAYARTYPQNVERLILDSAVDPDDADPFGLAGFRAMAPTLRALCPDACAGISADPAADLAALVARLRAAPLRGYRYTARGERRRGVVRPTAIADLMYDADYNPALRAGVPWAVRAALDGDAAPMLRLLAASARFASATPPELFSAARYATVCEETPLPVAARDADGRPLRRRPRPRAGAAARGVRPVRRRGRLRGRDRPLPALARSRSAAARAARAVPGGADAAAAGRGGPAHAAGGLGARRLADPGRAARQRARRRARGGRGRSDPLRQAPAVALPRRRAGAARAARACRRTSLPRRCRRARSAPWSRRAGSAGGPAGRWARSTRRSTSSTSRSPRRSTSTGGAAGCAAAATGWAGGSCCAAWSWSRACG